MINLRNNIKIAYRNAQKNKVLTFAKLFGISISFAVILFSAGYVYYETSFDKWVPEYQNIYRCYMKGKLNSNDIDLSVTSSLMANALVKDIPIVKEAVRLGQRGEATIFYNNDKISCGNLMLADSNFFSFFGIEVKTTLHNPFETKTNIALAKSLAIQQFGSVDGALNKTVQLNGENCVISGVFNDFPRNFHLQYKIIQAFANINPNNIWDSQSYLTYFKTKTNVTDIEKLTFDITKMVYTYSNNGVLNPQAAKTLDDFKFDASNYIFYIPEPLKDIHFSAHRFDVSVTANKTYVYGAIILSLLVLLISSINFVNLTISNITARVKEIGIRKTNGAHNNQIGYQFVVESLFFWVIGFVISWIIYHFAGKLLANWLNIDIVISHKEYIKILLVTFVGLVVFNLVISYLPIQLISGKKILGLVKNANPPEKYFSVKNFFVCLQFVLSVFIILSALMVQKQVGYMVNKDRGYNTENVLMMSAWALPSETRKTFMKELESYPVIKSVSMSNELFGEDPSMNSVNFQPFTENNFFHSSIFQVDEEFTKTFDFKLVDGRFFDKRIETDKNAVVLNEIAAKAYTGKGSVIGKKVRINNIGYNVIGIVKDFNFRSLYFKIQPLVIMLGNNMGNLNIKFQTNQVDKAISTVQALWTKYNVNTPLEYEFHDEVLANQYSKDMQAKKLMGILSFISIIIACVGLYAISLLSIIKKTKEIGVRKVNGAKISEVMVLLNTDFIKWVILAYCVAAPAAWYLINIWLQNFAYKTPMSWWIFALAGILAVLVAVITVSWQSWRAATRNPVEALRYE